MKRHVILYVECLLRRLGLIPRHRAPILNSSIVPYPASCPQGSVARGWWRFMGIVEDAISSLHAFVHILCSPRTGISQQLRPAPQENAIDRQDNLVACCDPHRHPCIFLFFLHKKKGITSWTCVLPGRRRNKITPLGSELNLLERLERLVAWQGRCECARTSNCF